MNSGQGMHEPRLLMQTGDRKVARLIVSDVRRVIRLGLSDCHVLF